MITVSVLTEHFENDDPNHLCRVGVSYNDANGRVHLHEDCFENDEAFRKNLSVDRKIAAIETAIEKLFRKALGVS